MPSFEETLARMKGLYTYGKEINESNNLKTHTLEYHAVGADGINYGIIRECNKYYIKSAPKGKETIAEAYEYLGGFCNKGNYEYSSYANALKQFELKMASINEAHDANVNISTLDPFKKGEFLIEGTDKMKNEIARQRQIMYNVAMLMNESTEIGADRKGDVVKFDGKNPEAETGKKGDEGGKKTTANPAYAGSKTNGVEKKASPFKEGCPKCADQLSEEAAAAGKDTDINSARDWNDGFASNMNPKDANLFVDGAKTVNEEEEDWASKGLPGTPGVGDADTDHNNNPFDKSINENEEDIEDFGNDVEDDEIGGEGDDLDGEGEDFGGDDIDGDDGDISTDTDFDAGVEDVDDLEGDGDDFDAGLNGDDDIDGEMGDDLEDDSTEDGLNGGDDIMAQIQELQSQIDALKAQIGGGEEGSVVDDLGDDANEDDFGAEGEGDDLDGENTDTFDNGTDDDFGTEGDDIDGEMGDDLEDDSTEDGDVLDNGEESFEDDMDECGCVGGNCPTPNQMMESKKAKMDKIIESVVNRILSEDELHDFGKHPGYRKKPMELPSTGEDKNQWGRDWNDDSVHSETPFGTKIGNGDPFTQLVDAVTKDVMYQLKKGLPIEGEKKN